MLKNEEVNKKLKELNVPFILKMGVLGDFQFKFSILTQVLEKIYLNNLILFVQTKFQSDSGDFYLTKEQQKVISIETAFKNKKNETIFNLLEKDGHLYQNTSKHGHEPRRLSISNFVYSFQR